MKIVRLTWACTRVWILICWLFHILSCHAQYVYTFYFISISLECWYGLYPSFSWFSSLSIWTLCVYICTMKVYVLCGVLMANLLKPVCICSCTNTVALSLTSQYKQINIHLSISICIIAFFRRLIDIRIKNDISVLTDIQHKYPKNAVYVPQKQPTYFFLSPHRTNTENENKISTKTYMHACTKNSHHKRPN